VSVEARVKVRKIMFVFCRRQAAAGNATSQSFHVASLIMAILEQQGQRNTSKIFIKR
jgi:hypothetical protein